MTDTRCGLKCEGCESLTLYSCDPEHGDNPPGARIEQCKKVGGEIATPDIISLHFSLLFADI